jgi:hypothetical protein
MSCALASVSCVLFRELMSEWVSEWVKSKCDVQEGTHDKKCGQQPSYPKSYCSILHYCPSIVCVSVSIHRVSFIISKSEVYDRCTVAAISSRDWNIPGYCRKRVRNAEKHKRERIPAFLDVTCCWVSGSWHPRGISEPLVQHSNVASQKTGIIDLLLLLLQGPSAFAPDASQP